VGYPHNSKVLTELKVFLTQPESSIKRFVVTGSRSWTDWVVVRDSLRSVHAGFPNAVMANGRAYGADCIAGVIWTHAGGWVQYYPPDYQRHGKSAPFVRNVEMVESEVQLCLAFSHAESKGTAHTIRKALDCGIPTFVFIQP
jgi:hypothetical protein